MELSANDHVRGPVSQCVCCTSPYLGGDTDALSYSLLRRTPDERYHLLTSDLRMTTLYLKMHPKVYWIWTHRKWCLEHVPDGPGRRINGEGGDSNAQQSYVNGHNTSSLETSGEVDRENMQTPNPTITSLNGDSEENDVEGWKKEAWGRELMLVEKMLEADSRNCESAKFAIHEIVPLNSSNFSPCMGLPAIRPFFITIDFPSSEDTGNGNQVHDEKD